MMTCVQTRAALLEADLAELGRPATTPLAGHLGTCAECRRLADWIVAGTDALRRERARPPRRSPGEASTAAAQEATAIRRVRRRWLTATPALAAAGLAAVLLTRSRGPGLPSAPSPPSTPSAPAAAPAAPADVPLVASTARTVAVFETANPKIIVVWQFPD